MHTFIPRMLVLGLALSLPGCAVAAYSQVQAPVERSPRASSVSTDPSSIAGQPKTTRPRGLFLAELSRAVVRTGVVKTVVYGEDAPATTGITEIYSDYRTEFVKARITLANPELPKVIFLIESPSLSYAATDPDRGWLRIVPDDVKTKNIRAQAAFVTPYRDPLIPLKSATYFDNFILLGTDSIEGVPVKKWQSDNAGTASAKFEVWLDVQGFPRRVVQDSGPGQNRAVARIDVSPSTDSGRFAEPDRSKWLVPSG